MIIKISDKNSKMGKIPSFSLPPIVTCPASCAQTCARDCYAMKAYRMYPAVKNAYNVNLEVINEEPELFLNDMREYLSKKKPRFFRIHVAGDFINEAYARLWNTIASEFPETKFLAFTKAYRIVQQVDWCDNVTIIFSAWTGLEMPDWVHDRFQVAWMQDGNETRIPKNAIECHGKCDTCGMCWNLPSIGRDVYFNKH